MHVLLVGNFLASANAHAMGEDLAAHLERAGWEVTRTSREPGRVARLTDMVTTAWRLRHRYDVAQVSVYSGAAFVWAEAVCQTLRLAGRPYVLTLHGGNLPAFARRWPRRVGRLLRHAAAVTAPSRYLLDQLAEHCAGAHLVPNPLELADYRFRLRDRPRPVLLWLRAFHPLYAPAVAPAVVAELARTEPGVALCMVGPETHAAATLETREAIARLALHDRVTLRGKVDRRAVPAVLNEADVFLNTSTVDNTPVSILEAMACGLCVVTTRVGGIPYLLRDGHDALLVPPNDAPAMAAAVRRVLHEPGLAARLSYNARETVERFGWEHVLPQWDALLRTAVKQATGDRRRETGEQPVTRSSPGF
jgi:glycosyltransferase involved in cell wall biosynthesis